MKSNFITAILLASTALCSASLSARAGDLPSTRAASAPVVAHEFDWTGPYGSVYAGAAADTSATTSEFGEVDNDHAIGSYGQAYPGYQGLMSQSYYQDANYANIQAGNVTTLFSDIPPSFPIVPTSFGEGNKLIGAAGGELGYNKQMGHAIVGVAADFTFLSHSKANNWNSSGTYEASGAGGTGCDYINSCTGAGEADAFGSVQANTNWVGTLRGNIGFAQDRLMVYGTGGLAVGQVHMASSASWNDTNHYCGLNGGEGTCANPTGGSFTYSDGTTGNWSGSRTLVKVGYAVGGGMNYALTDNVFLKLEGLYYDLGKESLTVHGTGSYTCTQSSGSCTNPSGPVDVASYKISKLFDGVITKVGLGYKF